MFDSGGFVHLDVRSNFSLKDGAFFPEELALRAAELGMPAVALTDRDGLYGAVRFVDACAKSGISPILGATLTVRPDMSGPGPPAERLTTERGAREELAERRSVPDRPNHDHQIVLLAQDAAGYANLCRLVTDAHMTGERGDPALAPEQVLAHAQGLVCLLGPRSHVGRLAVAGRHDAAIEALTPFRDAFGERLYIEVQHRLEESSNAEIRRLLRLAGEAGIRAVAANPVRYLVREDAFLADALECMREIVPVADHHLSRTNAEGYLKPANEMRALFAERPDLCDAALDIAERCTFDLGLRKVHFPDFPTPAGRSAASVLAERCHHGLERRGKKLTRDVRDRLDLELAMIRRLGYAAYFLTVAEIVADVKAMGIRCACRGSAAGSLVCYLTGISDVDPIHHGLVFERFLNPLRDELPDIDVDVESARRADVYDMVLSRHGDDRCACVCMVETYRARAAVREAGKALGLPDTEVDLVAKSFPQIGAHHIRDAIAELPELKGSNLGAGQLESLFRVAERLNGFPRHLALHPSAITLAGHDLVERVPLERSFQGYRMIQADKDDVELLGYLKLDVLGVRMLSAMRHCLDEIARTEATKVDLDDIPRDDLLAFELIRSSDTLGCFQIESPGQRELLQKLQPTRWEDLIVDISLFRPGPVKSDMVSPFLKRRHGMEQPVYAHPSLRPVLSETFGVVVYHEQVMRTFAVVAGYDLSEADRIRRHLSDDLEVDAIREDFLRRVRDRGMGDADAERIWKELHSFASFGFCKAHAAAFSVPTYQSAYLKAHWPAHFLAGVLTHEPGMYPRRLILEDARLHGIPILPLDVNLSDPDYTVEPVDAASRGPTSSAWCDGGARPPAQTVLAPSLFARSLRNSPSTGPRRRLPSRTGNRVNAGTSGAVPAGAPCETRIPDPAASDKDNAGMSGGARRRGGPVEQLERAKKGPPTSPLKLRERGGPDAATAAANAEGVRPGAPALVYGIRLALKDVHGISDGEVRSILEARAERAFADVGDFVRRTNVSRPVVEALAHAGAFDSLPSGTRRDRLFAAMVTESARKGDQLTLALAPDVAPGLREYTSAERVRAELEVIEMDASRHLLSFYEPLLAAMGVTRSRDLWKLRGGARVLVAGVKVASQTPAVRSGQRIIFLTLDDATGPVDVTVFESVQERCAKTVFHSFLLAVRGTLRRTGVKGVSIIAEEVFDLAALHRERRDAGALGENAARRRTPKPPVKLWHASGGSAGW